MINILEISVLERVRQKPRPPEIQRTVNTANTASAQYRHDDDPDSNRNCRQATRQVPREPVESSFSRDSGLADPPKATTILVTAPSVKFLPDSVTVARKILILLV